MLARNLYAPLAYAACFHADIRQYPDLLKKIRQQQEQDEKQASKAPSEQELPDAAINAHSSAIEAH